MDWLRRVEEVADEELGGGLVNNGELGFAI